MAAATSRAVRPETARATTSEEVRATSSVATSDRAALPALRGLRARPALRGLRGRAGSFPTEDRAARVESSDRPAVRKAAAIKPVSQDRTAPSNARVEVAIRRAKKARPAR